MKPFLAKLNFSRRSLAWQLGTVPR
jgi:hypothetical protein